MSGPSVSDLLTFATPEGRAEIAALIAKCKDDRGAGWIDAIKIEYPLFSWLIDLAANYEAEAAYLELKKVYPNYPLALLKGQLISMHGWLKAEIEKPRGL